MRARVGGWLLMVTAELIVLGVLLAAAGVVLYCGYKAFAFWRRLLLVGRTTLTSIEDLEEGVAKVRGRLTARDPLLRSPMTGTRCVYFRFVVQEQKTVTNHSFNSRGGHSSSTRTYWKTVVNDAQGIRVTIADKTGEANLDVHTAEVVCEGERSDASGMWNDPSERLERVMKEVYGVSTSGWVFNKTMRYKENVLLQGDRVLVVGRVLTPRKGVPKFQKGFVPLLISDKNEKRLLSHYRWRGIGYTLAFLAVAVVSGFIGHWGYEHYQRQANRHAENPQAVNSGADALAKWDQKGEVYLDDLPEASSLIGWGKLGKKGMLGYGSDHSKDELKATVGGKNTLHCLSTHPQNHGNGAVLYRFRKMPDLVIRGHVAVNDLLPKDVPQATPVTFLLVNAEKKGFWVSRPMKAGDPMQPFEVSLADLDHVELQVNCPGPFFNARAIWWEVRFAKGTVAAKK